VLVVALTAVLVAACGGDGGNGDDGGGASASGGAGGHGGDGGPVEIEHRYGTTEVAVGPERIVSLDVQWTDVLLSLGTTPVGQLDDPTIEGDLPWRGDRMADATSMEATDALPYEQIAALEPDLIVVTYLAQDEAAYDTLSGIAPTIPTLSANQVDTWQDIAGAAGSGLGAEDEAAALVDDVDSAVTAVGEELPGLAGKTFALVNYVPGDAFHVVADPDDGANVVFSQLGLELPPRLLDAADDVTGRVELSLEQSSLLDADVLLLLTNGAEPETIAGYDQLPAVVAGSAAVLDHAVASGLNTPTPLSVPYALERIRPALDAAAGAS
jgi:iron complex transport system substrate-binding protein